MNINYQKPVQSNPAVENDQHSHYSSYTPPTNYGPTSNFPSNFVPTTNSNQWYNYGQGAPNYNSPCDTNADYSNTPSKPVPTAPVESHYMASPLNGNQVQQQMFGANGLQMPKEYLAHPLTNVAMHYGTKLMGSGKDMVDKEINKFVTVDKLRYFFSVDTQYVLKKLMLLVFPFRNQDWSLKYNEKVRLEPRYDHNAPDLYMPLMGYVTYVLIAALVLGNQNLFSPEVLGIIASQALAWTVVEILLQLVALYFTSIPTNLTTLDLLAYSGYKFIGIILSVIFGLLFSYTGYLICVIYCALTLAYFMIQTLKWRLMSETEDVWKDQSMNSSFATVAYKRKMYFLVLIAFSHVLQMWWLSSSLVNQKSM